MQIVGVLAELVAVFVTVTVIVIVIVIAIAMIVVVVVEEWALGSCFRWWLH